VGGDDRVNRQAWPRIVELVGAYDAEDAALRRFVDEAMDDKEEP